MGFPQKRPLDKDAFFSGRGGDYVCPRCKSRVEELPSQCTVCKLTLVSSAHLARSYHHLFPVPPFTEGFGLDDEGKRHTSCFACYVDFEEGNESTSNENAPSVCPKCKKTFCFVCDVYIHEKLHNCPGCELVKFLAEEGQ
eukprot:30935-Pelagococcus_subviridis.AAC.28